MIYSTKAVKAIILNENKILIVKNKNNFWDLPGGLIDENETNEEALKREVLEETSLEIVIKSKAGSWEFVRSYDKKTVQVVNYLCVVKEDNMRFKLSIEHSDFKWIFPAEIINFNIKDESLAKSLNQEIIKKKTDENKA